MSENAQLEGDPQERDEVVTERDLMEQLVQLQEKQNATLSEIQKHTGCLYNYLIVSVILGVLLTLYYVLFLMPISRY